MLVLSKDGDHVPVIPLLDVVGKALNVPPEQIAGTCVKTGLAGVFTVMVNVCVVAHKPADGVNVYVAVVVLSKDGDHVPVIPLVEVVGRGLNAAPEHIAATGVNVGVIFGFTVIVSVAVVAHKPAAGVNV